MRLWGFRLGRTDVTDVTHPHLTSVCCPFNLLRSFKEGAHRTKTDFINACVSFRRMSSVLEQCAPSLNVRSKLKEQCTDVKSRCVTSVVPSLTPTGSVQNKNLVLLSL